MSVEVQNKFLNIDLNNFNVNSKDGSKRIIPKLRGIPTNIFLLSISDVFGEISKSENKISKKYGLDLRNFFKILDKFNDEVKNIWRLIYHRAVTLVEKILRKTPKKSVRPELSETKRCNHSSNEICDLRSKIEYDENELVLELSKKSYANDFTSWIKEILSLETPFAVCQRGYLACFFLKLYECVDKNVLDNEPCLLVNDRLKEAIITCLSQEKEYNLLDMLLPLSLPNEFKEDLPLAFIEKEESFYTSTDPVITGNFKPFGIHIQNMTENLLMNYDRSNRCLSEKKSVVSVSISTAVSSVISAKPIKRSSKPKHSHSPVTLPVETSEMSAVVVDTNKFLNNALDDWKEKLAKIELKKQKAKDDLEEYLYEHQKTMDQIDQEFEITTKCFEKCENVISQDKSKLSVGGIFCEKFMKEFPKNPKAFLMCMEELEKQLKQGTSEVEALVTLITNDVSKRDLASDAPVSYESDKASSIAEEKSNKDIEETNTEETLTEVFEKQQFELDKVPSVANKRKTASKLIDTDVTKRKKLEQQSTSKKSKPAVSKFSISCNDTASDDSVEDLDDDDFYNRAPPTPGSTWLDDDGKRINKKEKMSKTQLKNSKQKKIEHASMDLNRPEKSKDKPTTLGETVEDYIQNNIGYVDVMSPIQAEIVDFTQN